MKTEAAAKAVIVLVRQREVVADRLCNAARDLVRSGYDGPFMGEDVEPLFRAVRELEALDADIAELDK